MMPLLAQWLVAGVLLAAVADLCIRLVPQTAAAERHLLWWLTLMAVAVLPLLLLCVPSGLVPFDGGFMSGPAASAADALGAPSSLITIAPPADWIGTAVLAMWGIWVAGSGLRFTRGLLALRRLVTTARPLTGVAVPVARRAAVLVSPHVGAACAIGFFRPRVLVSSQLATTLDEPALAALVLHESAHLARWDDWTRVAQRLLVAIAGLHPAVWWSARAIDREAEAACDQFVVSRTGDALTYVQVLAVAARTHGGHPSLAPGAAAAGLLHTRVQRLLEGAPVSRTARVSRAALGAAAVVAGVVAGLALPPVVGIATPVIAEVLAASPLAERVVVAQPEPPSVRAGRSAHGIRPAVVHAHAEPGLPDVPRPRPLTETQESDARAPVVVAPAPSSVEVLESPGLRRELPFLSSSGGPATGGAGIGASAAKLGLATADTASRTGQSLGRFFTRTGQAIADQF